MDHRDTGDESDERFHERDCPCDLTACRLCTPPIEPDNPYSPYDRYAWEPQA